MAVTRIASSILASAAEYDTSVFVNLLAELTAARNGKGLSQSDLAERLGVSRLAITRLEGGSGSISLLQRAMDEVGLRVSGVARGHSLPAQLRTRRLRLDVGERQLAVRAGIDVRTLKSVEQGEGTVASLLAILAAIAPKAKKSKPPRASWNYDPRYASERDKRFTPSWFLNYVVEAFGEIDLDPCAHPAAAVEARRKIILPEDGLMNSWAGHGLTFINPPFSAVTKWMARACEAWDRREVSAIVMLVPVRTDSPTFQNRVSREADVLFLAGRMRFESTQGLAWPAPFSLMLVAWGVTEGALQRFTELAPSVWMKPSRRKA